MFCPNCGRANLNSDNFCRYCGKRLKEEDPAQDTPTPSPETAPETDFVPEPEVTPRPEVAPPDADFSPVEPESSRKPGPSPFPPTLPSKPSFLLRSIMTSPAILTALIALSVALGFNMLGLSSISLLTLDTEEAYFFFSFPAFFALLSRAANALLVAGSWMTYSSIKAERIKDSGMTMVKVAVILKAVVNCILLVILEVLTVFTAMIFDYGDFADTLGSETLTVSILQGILVFLPVFVAAVIALAIIYYVKAFRTAEVIRNTMVTGVPSVKISVYVVVMLFVMSGIVALDSLYYLVQGEILYLLGGLCSAAAYISFGVFLFGYRKKMRVLMEDPSPRV